MLGLLLAIICPFCQTKDNGWYLVGDTVPISTNIVGKAYEVQPIHAHGDYMVAVDYGAFFVGLDMPENPRLYQDRCDCGIGWHYVTNGIVTVAECKIAQHYKCANGHRFCETNTCYTAVGRVK